MAPKPVFNLNDTALTSSHKRHRQRSAAASPMMTHDNMHRHMMGPYPSFNFQHTATARPMRRIQDEYDAGEDDDEPIFVPQIPVRRAAAAAPTAVAAAVPPSQQWMPAMPSYDEASPSGRQHRDNNQAARVNEQVAYDELMELYIRLRVSKKQGDGVAIGEINTSARRLHQVYLMWVQKKLEAYHELQLAKY